MANQAVQNGRLQGKDDITMSRTRHLFHPHMTDIDYDNIASDNIDDALLEETILNATKQDNLNLCPKENGKDMEVLMENGGTDPGEDIAFPETWFSVRVQNMEDWRSQFLTKHRRCITIGVYVLAMLLYLLYFGYCMYKRYGDEGSIVLLVITVCVVCKVFFKVLDYRGIQIGLPQTWHTCANSKRGRCCRRCFRILAALSVTAAIVFYLAVDIFPHRAKNLQSFLGMLAMIFLCFVFSSRPSRVNWHPVFWSFAIQFALAFVTLRTQIGQDIFKWLGNLIKTLFEFSDVGSAFVIGQNFRTFGLALSVSGVIIFINAFLSLLNHWGVIEFIVVHLGGFLSFCLGTGPVESVVAAANIFMTMMEAPLMIRPYLRTVTKSELHAIMTCGFASISGGAFGIFMRMGAPANHLLTASVISAPAALAIAKLMYPETEKVSRDKQSNIKITGKNANSVSAFADGAMLAIGVCAAAWSSMLAFVSMISLIDAVLGWMGDRAEIHGLTFGVLSSYVLFPLAFVMGADVSDCRKLGELIGIKLCSTPFISYQRLGFLIKNREVFEDYTSSPNNTSWSWVGDDIFLETSNTTLVGGIMSERTEVIATYAMCGFSAFSAIGVVLGALIPLCPDRKQDVVKLIFRAFIAGNVASFATGAVAGILITSDGVS